ncbi:MAG: FGGY-family carbohydrate kinase [Anaerobutyricum hallii]
MEKQEELFGRNDTCCFKKSCSLARAVMEGICYEMYDIIRAEEDSGIKIDKIRLAGGAAKSPLWCQMMADIFKHPIQILENGEAGCRGAATLRRCWSKRR